MLKTHVVVFLGMLCCLSAGSVQAQDDRGPVINKLPVKPASKADKVPKLEGPYVLVHVNVDEQGKAQDAKVVRSAGEPYDTNALAGLNSKTFTVRMSRGAPARYGVLVAVTFRSGEAGAGVQVCSVSPPKLLYVAEPEFPVSASGLRGNASVLVGLVVDEEGKPQQVRVLKGVQSSLDDKAADAVRRYVLRPATCDGKAVSTPMNVVVNFIIP